MESHCVYQPHSGAGLTLGGSWPAPTGTHDSFVCAFVVVVVVVWVLLFCFICLGEVVCIFCFVLFPLSFGLVLVVFQKERENMKMQR